MLSLALQLPLNWHHFRDRSIEVRVCDRRWAQAMVEQHHYLHKRVHDFARPLAYSIHDAESGAAIGCVILGLPQFVRKQGVFGYPGLPTQWQVLMVYRVWIDPEWQDTIVNTLGQNHARCVASSAIAQIIKRVNQDWLQHSPPRFPDQPYNLRLLISYSDLDAQHRGTLYQASNFAFASLSQHSRAGRHSKLRRSAPTLRLCYCYWLRRGYDPISGQTHRYAIPDHWVRLQNDSKDRLQAFFERYNRGTNANPNHSDQFPSPTVFQVQPDLHRTLPAAARWQARKE